MSMAVSKSEKAPIRDRLEDAVRETLKAHLKAGDTLDVLTEELVTALRGRFSLIERHRKPRKDTPRALAQRLPEAGVSWKYTRGTRVYTILVVDEHTVVLQEGESEKRLQSLKAVATEILGYYPGIGGWRYFFGEMSYDEVSARYKR